MPGKMKLLLFSILFCLVPSTECTPAQSDVYQVAGLRAGGGSQTSWIQDFCQTPGNEFFAEVRGIFAERRDPFDTFSLAVRRPTFDAHLGN